MSGAGNGAARPDILAGSATGSIYDLGYRRYEGPRLGRRHAIRALYVHSVKWAFGIGRGGRAKVPPFALAVVMLTPAAVVVGIRAIVGPLAAGAGISPASYIGIIGLFVVLFVTAQAPELVNRDLRSRLITLYFSRALARDDYAIAKFLALTTAVAAVLLAPQVLLLLGMVFASVDIGAGLGEAVPLVVPVVLSAIGVAAFVAAGALAISAFAPRRAFAAGAIIAAFLIPSGIVDVVINAGRLPAPARVVAFFDPFALVEGLVSTVFGEASTNRTIVGSELPPAAFAAVAIVVAVVAVAILLARYRRIEA